MSIKKYTPLYICIKCRRRFAIEFKFITSITMT